MKLSLNQNEARTLVMLLYLAEHVLTNDGDSVPDGFLRKCDALISNLLASARESGCDDLLKEDIDGDLFISPEIEEEPGMRETISEHEGSLFWRELVERLAERDYELNTGKPAIPEPTESWKDVSEMEVAALEAELEQLEASYWTEFEKHGVQRLHLMRGAGRAS
ncbi:MAG TPA: hypothetical protein VMM36_01860 [Opitutaceae bacterium]|nr:hypothetical protein [Opitutaceae bacterium]